MSFLFRGISRGCSAFSHMAWPSVALSKGSHFQTVSSGIQRSIISNGCSYSRPLGQKILYSSFHTQSNEGSTMHKTKKVGLFLAAGALLAGSLGAYAYANTDSSSPKLLKPVTSSTVQGTEWVRRCVDQYPEILWLADAKVRKTEEGMATLQGPYSEQLFGQKYIEFDRTIMTLRCLQLILDGSDKAYQEFTKAQPKDTKLSRTSFENLHLQAVSILKSKYQGMSELEIIQAMEASLVLGDIGKSEKARDVFKPYGANAPDHDDFHGEVMQILQKHPKLCPTFDRLTPTAKQLLSQTANLAHYGHVTHLEGGPSMFSKLREICLAGASPIALSFDFFVHTCDVAGALGHVDNQSSLVYTELSHLAMQGVADACKVLTDSQKTEMDAYNAYLTIRANRLGLNAQDRTDRALTRVGAMLRLFTPEDGLILKEAVLKLEPEARAKVIAQLDIQEGEELRRTPTYMPAVLVNLANNSQLGALREERISQAVVLGLPFLARVLEAHKQALKENRANSDIPLNFNQAAGVAKQSPTALLKGFNIDSEGNVCCSSD